MVRKLFLNIYVPAIGRTESFMISSAMRVREVIGLICRLLKDEYSGIDSVDDRMVLWNEESGGELLKERTLEEQNIHDGMRLILF